MSHTSIQVTAARSDRLPRPARRARLRDLRAAAQRDRERRTREAGIGSSFARGRFGAADPCFRPLPTHSVSPDARREGNEPVPGETIEQPALGSNELPHEPGTYAWWDGHRFTTIAFRANDHWEYIVDETPPRSPNTNEGSHSKVLLALVGATVGAVMLAVTVGFLVVVMTSTASL